MISAEMENWLNANIGDRNWSGEYYERYGHRLQDFTDKEVSEIIKRHRVKDCDTLFGLLMAKGDKEARAHLLGFDSHAQRMEMLEEVRRQQEKFK